MRKITNLPFKGTTPTPPSVIIIPVSASASIIIRAHTAASTSTAIISISVPLTIPVSAIPFPASTTAPPSIISVSVRIFTISENGTNRIAGDTTASHLGHTEKCTTWYHIVNNANVHFFPSSSSLSNYIQG